ncbi:unnamed protein product [Rotaria magnacalcarata]|uniref:Pentapeptide repeat-containing protein n=1 Tax=Rotaria magnacalcarata TaxID=392030 RepID=A0A8S2QET8_9BILA|nr:unnamed protein product [Rotaria magnacalcarata]
MASPEQIIRTDGSVIGTRDQKSVNFRGGLKFISSLLLPLALGVFTIVITFQQQSAAKQQRDDDRNAAEQQRINDRNAAEQQRINDRNTSQQQRDQEKQEAGLLRKQEENLDKQRYENGRFDAYIKEMGKLLKENNGSIISSQVAATLARVETLNIFRQLDAQRNVQIIRFLFEAKQLIDTPKDRSLDLSTAQLLDIDFRDTAVDGKQLDQLSLTGIFLSNATFIGIKMSNISFSRTKFDTANFSLAKINDANFSSAEFYNTSFASTSFSNTTFAKATFNNVNFLSKNIHGVNFKNIFLFSVLYNPDFSSASLSNVNFSQAVLFNSKFSSPIINAGFLSAILNYVGFSFAELVKADFSKAQFMDVNFSQAVLFNAKFSSAILNDVDFSFAELAKADFSKTQFMNVNFSSTLLISGTFKYAVVSNANFQQSSCVASIFDYGSLSYCNFSHSNLKDATFKQATLSQVNFSRANLYKTNFTGANMAKSELDNTLSIQDAILTNGIRGHDENLISNGQADCNISHISGWTVSNGNITSVISNSSNSNCQFTFQSLSTGATMYQRVNLSDKWDSNFWPYSQAVLSAKMSVGISMELKGIKNDHSVSSKETLSSNEKQINLLLHNNMWELEVFIQFNATTNHSNMKNYWCDDIKLYIIYGTSLESKYGLDFQFLGKLSTVV